MKYRSKKRRMWTREYDCKKIYWKDHIRIILSKKNAEKKKERKIKTGQSIYLIVYLKEICRHFTLCGDEHGAYFLLG